MAVPKSGKPTILIIGASFAGAGVAHRLLKQLPQAKVILVNPSDLWYFCFAAPRLITKPSDTLVTNETAFLSISDAFKQYPPSSFEFIVDSVSTLDLDSKSAELASGKRVAYDIVVVASGSTTPATVGKEEVPYKHLEGANTHIKAQISHAQQKIIAANSILIAGAGPVGVETAGEIAEAYPNKKVTIVCRESEVLPHLKPSVRSKALSLLKKRGVEVLLDTNVESAEPNADGQSWTVSLSGGKPTRKVSYFISATGNLPNNSFMPPQTLDPSGWIKIDGEMRIHGTEASDSAYALGDCTTLLPRTSISAGNQVPVVASNVKEAVLRSGKRTVYKPSTTVFAVVPVGSTAGTGQIGSVTLPSFAVAALKAKDMLVGRAKTFLYAK